MIGVEIDEDEEGGVWVFRDGAEERDDLAAEDGDEAETGVGGEGRVGGEEMVEGGDGGFLAGGAFRVERAGSVDEDPFRGEPLDATGDAPRALYGSEGGEGGAHAGP